MPRVYDKMGIWFMYPDNWTLDEGEAAAGSASVSVYSPEGSFWSIVLDRSSVDPAVLTRAALQSLKSEYEDNDAEPTQETIAGREIHGFEIHFFCLDLTSTAVIQGFRTRAASCLVMWQAEDRDLGSHEMVFRAITTSLVKHDAEASR